MNSFREDGDVETCKPPSLPKKSPVKNRVGNCILPNFRPQAEGKQQGACFPWACQSPVLLAKSLYMHATCCWLWLPGNRRAHILPSVLGWGMLTWGFLLSCSSTPIYPLGKADIQGWIDHIAKCCMHSLFICVYLLALPRQIGICVNWKKWADLLWSCPFLHERYGKEILHLQIWQYLNS